jgi:hypothetical protein
MYGEIAIFAVSRRFLSVSEMETQKMGWVENWPGWRTVKYILWPCTATKVYRSLLSSGREGLMLLPS